MELPYELYAPFAAVIFPCSDLLASITAAVPHPTNAHSAMRALRRRAAGRHDVVQRIPSTLSTRDRPVNAAHNARHVSKYDNPAAKPAAYAPPVTPPST